MFWLLQPQSLLYSGKFSAAQPPRIFHFLIYFILNDWINLQKYWGREISHNLGQAVHGKQKKTLSRQTFHACFNIPGQDSLYSEKNWKSWNPSIFCWFNKRKTILSLGDCPPCWTVAYMIDQLKVVFDPGYPFHIICFKTIVLWRMLFVAAFNLSVLLMFFTLCATPFCEWK